MTIEERKQLILAEFGLDFTIEKKPLVMPLGDKTVMTDYFGLRNSKTGEIINTVKSSYRVSQNDEILEMVLRGMDGFGELSVYNAGSIDGGRKVFIQLAVEGFAKVGDDLIKRYVTIIDSNDGSTGLSVGTGDLTMSCRNQFYRFYKAGIAKWRHSASMDAKIQSIPTLISLSLEESMRLVEIYNKFASVAVNNSVTHKLVKTLLGVNKLASVNELNEKSTRTLNAMEALYNHIEKEMNQKGKNLWGLHSGVTSWTTHEKSAPRRENGRIESSMVGTNYRTNQQSLEFALELVK